jgi:hypothetical protein
MTAEQSKAKRCCLQGLMRLPYKIASKDEVALKEMAASQDMAASKDEGA